jgi:hypothetical protein
MYNVLHAWNVLYLKVMVPKNMWRKELVSHLAVRGVVGQTDVSQPVIDCT